jgi:hypothetical protein
MNRREFSIQIEAEKPTIWHALWDESLYRDWTSVFFEGSHLVAENWEEGNHVHFLDPNKDGIYSLIDKHIPNEFIRFKHIGNVKNGKELPVDEETKKWSGATEIYKIIEGDKANTLVIEIDIMDEHLESMTKTFSKALEKVKNNCS